MLPLVAPPTTGNNPPVAVDVAYEVREDTTLVVGVAAGVLANDSDPDGDALQAELAEDVTHGTLVLRVTVFLSTHQCPTFTARIPSHIERWTQRAPQPRPPSR
ncbi:MAG: Ig-like domain-containing protein [Caldilineaceae bacterium]